MYLDPEHDAVYKVIHIFEDGTVDAVSPGKVMSLNDAGNAPSFAPSYPVLSNEENIVNYTRQQLDAALHENIILTEPVGLTTDGRFLILKQPYLVTIRGKGAVIRQTRAIWTRAGVEPWKRLWQTLRQSCEKEWAMSFPQYAVSKWIGHSITVSGRHYANHVPDELFDKATITGNHNENSAQRHAQQNMHESTRSGEKQKKTASEAGGLSSSADKNLRDISISPCQIRRWSRGESNPRPDTVGHGLLHV